MKKPFDQDKQDISAPQPADVEALTEKIQHLEIENRRLKIKNEYLEELKRLKIARDRKQKQGLSSNAEKDIR